MKIHDGVEAPGKKMSYRILVFDAKNLIDIGITVQAVGVSGFHKNADTEIREFLLYSVNGRCQQKTVSHRPKAYE